MNTFIQNLDAITGGYATALFLQGTDLNPSIKHLKAFMALAREHNFTRAAETCHLSQPAFSTLMRNLEDYAGVRLFDRSTRIVALTPEGEVFAATAERLLQDFEGAFGELREHASRRKDV